MKEPSIKIGFIIINERYKMELESENGHRRTAFKWIKQNKLISQYNSVLGTNGIYDEEDFLIEYIGAIKLYGYCGHFYCRMPKMLNNNKEYYRRYYESLGYKVISQDIYDEEKTKVKVYKNEYNKTILKKFNNELIYNPLKDGD